MAKLAALDTGERDRALAGNQQTSYNVGNFKSIYVFSRAGKDKNGVTRTAATGERTSGPKEYFSVEAHTDWLCWWLLLLNGYSHPLHYLQGTSNNYDTCSTLPTYFAIIIYLNVIITRFKDTLRVSFCSPAGINL